MPIVSFIINGSLNNIDTIKKNVLSEAPEDFEILFFVTERRNDGSRLINDAITGNSNFIIAVGGDGTINEVVNGSMLLTEAVRSRVVFGILPNGTGNDFARSLQMKKSVGYLFKLLKQNKTQFIDLGQANFTNLTFQRESRYFINIAEIGVGAKTVQYVNNEKKLLNPVLTFLWAVIRSFSGYKHQDVTILFNNITIIAKVVAVCFANGRFFGSGLGISPYSDISDGRLNLVLVGGIKMFDFILKLPLLRKCKPIKHNQVSYNTFTEASITSNMPHQFPFEMDGEFVGYTPIDVKIIPGVIQFLV